jgi:hypothetical protein
LLIRALLLTTYILALSAEDAACKVGRVGTLYLDEKATAAPVGQDRDTFYAFLKAQKIGDEQGMLQMLESGKVFIVKTREQKIRVLGCDKGERQSQIRVVDGRHAGRAGWTFSGWIR